MLPTTSPPIRRHTSPAPVVVHADREKVVTVEAAAVAETLDRPASKVMRRYLRACRGALQLVGWDEDAAAWVLQDEDGRRRHLTEDEAREYLAFVAAHKRRVVKLARITGAARGTRRRVAVTTRTRRAPLHRVTRQGRVTTRRRTTSHAASSAGGARDDGGGEPSSSRIRVALADTYRFERTAPAGGAA